MNGIEDEVSAVQRAYPRIYQACHARHVRKATTMASLSPRDATVLAHLDPKKAVRAGLLARHLGLASVLQELTPAERKTAVRGLELIARASVAVQTGRTRRAP